MNIRVGDWVKSYSMGIWRVERIIKDHFEPRWSLHEPKERSKKILVQSKRLLNEKGKRSFSTDICDSVFIHNLTTEEYTLLEDYLKNNNKVLKEFEKYDKPVDLVMNLSFSVDQSWKNKFRLLADNSFCREMEKGLISDAILSIIENSEIHEYWKKTPPNQTLQFVCENHEVMNSEFVFRKYVYCDF